MGRIAALIHPFGDFGRSSAVARREARLATAACILSRWKGDLATWEGEAWIMWSSVGGRVEAGGLRVLEFKIQGCSEVVEGEQEGKRQLRRLVQKEAADEFFHRRYRGLVEFGGPEDAQRRSVGDFFFLPDGCMAQRSRCPGGRPSDDA